MTNAWDSVRAAFSAPSGLSVLLPCFNLEGRILPNLKALTTRLREEHICFELIPIDDASSDATAQELATLQEPEIHPLYLQQNMGKGAALLTAFSQASYPWVLFLDGDLDLSIDTLPAFCNIQQSTQADVIAGSKRHPQAVGAYPWFRKLPSAIYHTFTQYFLHLPLSDTQAGMKLVRKEAFAYAAQRMLVKRFAFDLEMLTIMQQGGYQLAEAPVKIEFGNKWGCLTWNTIWVTLRDTLAIFYRARLLHYYTRLTLPPSPPDTCDQYFSIIIACPSDSALLQEVFVALARQTYHQFEVIVLPDEPLPTPPSTPFALHVIPTGHVRPAEKRNVGASHAKGDVLVFLDDDAYPDSNWLAAAAAQFTHRPTITALGGPAITPPNDPYLAQLSGLTFASLLVSGNFRYRYFIEGSLRKIDDYPSCNLFVKTDAFKTINGFREDFWPGEDTLLCADLLTHHYEIYYDPRVIVYHHRRALFLPHLRQVQRYAMHRGYFVKRIGKNSRCLSYWIPSLFTLGLLSGLGLLFLAPFFLYTYLFAISLYGLILMSYSCLGAPRWRDVPLLACAIFATHLTYGIYFIVGLCATRMPCEVKAFDHRSH